MSHTTTTMTTMTTQFPKLTIGLDLGDRTSRTYEVNADGTCVREGIAITTVAGITHYFGQREACRVVLEVGTHSPWVSRLLAELGHEAIVANPSAMFGTAPRPRRRRRRRNDRLDARFLGRQGRADVALLYPITHRSADAQRDLESLRARDQLVGVRTKLINHVRGTVKSSGARLSRCSADVFAKRARGELPPALAPALTPLVDVIADLTQRIAAAETQLATLARERYPVAERLQQPAGVGPLTALAFVLLIEDPHRFRTSRDVGPYFGLVPRLDDSSDSTPQLRISKAGDEFGRRLLVSAAHYILGPFGPECDLRRYGRAIAERGGKNAKKRAVIAVARKLAVLLHRLWISGATYDVDHQRKQRAA
jgi:transposase